MIARRFSFWVLFVSVISCVLVLGSRRHDGAEPKLQLDIYTLSSGKELKQRAQAKAKLRQRARGKVIAQSTTMRMLLYITTQHGSQKPEPTNPREARPRQRVKGL
ncbi:uncharacterized protein CCOS01_01250 [Colletotrichum costaricense]|nr:uncharacterized protein CCOS01_01250 [Colletotrichum costaricense]KAK1539936.1 hypothetical protein CCOS01_01250 [Colletotrichum costaricense]KAK1717682.1 hypothetical protein BDP67DRAFT_225143 [Colletotrichum lupini]